MSREHTDHTRLVGWPGGVRRRGRRGRVAARTLGPVLASVLLLVACDDDPSPSEPADAADVEVDDEVAPEEEAAATDDAGAEDDVDAAASDAAQEQPPRVPVPDVAPIELLTPVAGGGAWPQLDWEPVADGERYRVRVYGPDGRAFWGWMGTDDQVIFGGFPRTPEDGSAVTPQVLDGMSWSVIAFDADGRIVGQSGERPLEP